MVKKTRRLPQPRFYKDAEIENYEHFPAWKMDDYEAVIQFLTTNTLENTFYVSQAELLHEGLELLERFSDIPFLADAIVQARLEGYMRTAPLMALVYLSMKKDEREGGQVGLGYFKDIFNSVVRTGRDMQQFLDIARRQRGLGRGIKKAIVKWIQEYLTEWRFLKYQAAFKDAARLAHPHTELLTDPQRKLLAYSLRDDQAVPSGLKQVQAFEAMKLEAQKDNPDPEKIIQYIHEGRLDYTIVIGTISPSPEIWMALAAEMATFAFLRHLATFERNNLLSRGAMRELVTQKLTVSRLKHAKVFPFRLYQAYTSISHPPTKEYLSQLLDQYVPQYDYTAWGRVFLAPDVSGSMQSKYPRLYHTRSRDGRTITKRSTIVPATIAGMFAGLFYKGIEPSWMMPWDDALRNNLVQPKSAPVISHVHAISNHRGGGTEMDLPVNFLIQQEIEVDNFLLITDDQEWYRSQPMETRGFLRMWAEYKQKIAPEARAILLRVDPYPRKTFSGAHAEEYNIHQIFGWSPSVMDYIQYVIEKGV